MMRIFFTLLLLVLSAGQPEARTWYVSPDGTGDAPTIAAAIDSSVAGDVIELACGTFIEWGLLMKSGITIRSETGQPDCVITGNYAKAGGGVYISFSHPVFIECDISGNDCQFYPGGVEVGLDSSFTAHETSILSNTSGLGNPDGSVREGSEAFFYCCDIDTGNWLFEGTYLIDDEDCGQVANETQSWGSLKSLFR